jgi:hypothetical protein
MKFTIEQRVFIVESFVREKLTKNVSASFVLTFIVLQGQSSGPRSTREECYAANLVAQSGPLPDYS